MNEGMSTKIFILLDTGWFLDALASLDLKLSVGQSVSEWLIFLDALASLDLKLFYS